MIQDLMDLIFEKYYLVELRDSCDGERLGLILLNNKHSIGDFQDAIDRAKEKHEQDIEDYGDDWSFISEELNDFDYYEIGNGDYYVEY